MQETIIKKKLRFYVIDGYTVARAAGMGSRINTIMQTCFFAISGVLPREEAIAAIKKAILDTYGKRGEAVVQKNYAAVDAALAHMHEVKVPAKVTALFDMLPAVSPQAPKFVRDVLGTIVTGNGDSLPVSAMPIDGTFPTGTAMWEKRNIAKEIPVWDEALCIQCGKCVLVCPHAVIRAKVYDSSLLKNAPETFKSSKPRWREFETLKYTLQVAPEDCTGCKLCVEVCPAKSKSEVKHKAINMEDQAPLRKPESVNWEFLPVAAGIRPQQAVAHAGERFAVARAAVRIFGRLRGLRRNAVHQAADAALRRPAADRECHRLLLDLWRKPADDSVHAEQGGTRTYVVELTV